MTINTAFIKANILPQYSNNVWKRITKRKFKYDNCVLYDLDINGVLVQNPSTPVLNGLLNWRCYNDGNQTIYIIDDGVSVLYHGINAAIPTSYFITEYGDRLDDATGKIYIELLIQCAEDDMIELLEKCEIDPELISVVDVVGVNKLINNHLVSHACNSKEFSLCIFFNFGMEGINTKLEEYIEYMNECSGFGYCEDNI